MDYILLCLVPSGITDTSYSLFDNIFHLKVLLVHMSFLMIHLITAYSWLIFCDISRIMKRSQQSEETLGKKLLKLKEELGNVGWSSVIDEMDYLSIYIYKNKLSVCYVCCTMSVTPDI